jgi:hypothetical protein
VIRLNDHLRNKTLTHELNWIYCWNKFPLLASHRGGPGSRQGSIWGLWWTKRHWDRFSPNTSVSPATHHSTNFSIIIINRGGNNRPICGRSDQWIQLDSTPPPTTSIKKNPILQMTHHWKISGVIATEGLWSSPQLHVLFSSFSCEYVLQVEWLY